MASLPKQASTVRRLYYNDIAITSHELPQRIHTARTYPYRAPNGSTIFLYGHASGLSVAWIDGDPPKVLEPSPLETGAQNVPADEDVIMIDSDDEAPAQPVSQKETSSQSETHEDDETSKPDSVVAVANIRLGTAVLHLDCLSLKVPSVGRRTQTNSTTPDPISQNILVALACADGTTRLLSIPIAPQKARMIVDLTTNEYEGPVQATTIRRSATSGPCKLVALTYTTLADNSSDTAKPTQKGSNNNLLQYGLVVVSHVASPTNLLDVHSMRLDLMNPSKLLAQPIERIARKFIHAPLCAVQFNTDKHPSWRHLQFLCADTQGSIRLFDVSHTSHTGADIFGNTPIRCRALTTLFSPFSSVGVSADAVVSTARRCRVLDAKWVLSGKAIMVLLENGQWGVFDLECAGPREDDSGNASGASGAGAGVRFALSSSVPSALPTARVPKSSKTSPALVQDKQRLAPMTPKTRKDNQRVLFSQVNESPGLSQKSSTFTSVRGGLAVAPLPLSSATENVDESITLWYNETAYILPSLLKYWHQAVGRGSGRRGQRKSLSPQSSDSQSSFVPIPGFTTFGEFVTSISQIVHHADSTIEKTEPGLHPRALPQPLIIAAEHRFVSLRPLLATDQRPTHQGSAEILAMLQTPDTSLQDGTSMQSLDQVMLERGELDIQGMDRVIEGMDHANIAGRSAKKPRQVGFANA